MIGRSDSKGLFPERSNPCNKFSHAPAVNLHWALNHRRECSCLRTFTAAGNLHSCTHSNNQEQQLSADVWAIFVSPICCCFVSGNVLSCLST